MLKFKDLKHDIELIRCVPCWGSGRLTISTEDLFSFREPECPICNGSGINPEYQVTFGETRDGTKCYIITKID